MQLALSGRGLLGQRELHDHQGHECRAFRFTGSAPWRRSPHLQTSTLPAGNSGIAFEPSPHLPGTLFWLVPRQQRNAYYSPRLDIEIVPLVLFGAIAPGQDAARDHCWERIGQRCERDGVGAPEMNRSRLAFPEKMAS